MEKIRKIARYIFRAAVSVGTLGWGDYSRLFFIADTPTWSIGHDMLELACIAKQLGVKTGHPIAAIHGHKQSVFIGNHFDLLLSDRWFRTNHRLATAYFHGKPGQGVPEFDRCFEMLQKRHEQVHRIQVSCQSMRQVVLDSGIDPEKVHLIPIGINLVYFSQQTEESRISARKRFGVPQGAYVVGSFQKDGNGWGEGVEPKLIKGPDVFIESMRILKKNIDPLVVLLSGPARGYVKAGLEKIGVPYVHHMMKEYADIGDMYQALDVYVVASREEGGPKSVLESMASGIPLVSTRVGQANDIVVHGENGFLADIEDAEGLAHWAAFALEKGPSLKSITESGMATAKIHQYQAQLPLWREFFKGFVQ